MRVFLFDEFPPETSAMLQALYSRSSQSVLDHVRKVRERGPGKFMASYYVGYGHASIGDCGVTTLYLEDVSLLACKAFQDFPLYSGQETSTRYIDFSKQALIDPLGSSKTEALQRRWLDFYDEVVAKVTEHLKFRFPPPKESNEARWGKAIAARTFDILRGILPAGVCTNLSWTTNLRQAHEQLVRLEGHPLIEVQEGAAECRRILQVQYPSSFGHEISGPEKQYARIAAATEAYVSPDAISILPGEFRAPSDIDNARLEAEASELIMSRPRKMPLPKTLARFGHYRCYFTLDFGSFRDLQRHRGGLYRMPLLTSKLGFHPWYLDQLSEETRERVERFLRQQLTELDSLNRSLSPEDKQYYLPIGLNVACELMYDLPQMVYVAELRSAQTVHPTLRAIAQKLACLLSRNHPRLALYADMSPDEFCIRRADQDIVERPNAA
jgi:thymidylate synthase ThyX